MQFMWSNHFAYLRTHWLWRLVARLWHACAFFFPCNSFHYCGDRLLLAVVSCRKNQRDALFQRFFYRKHNIEVFFFKSDIIIGGRFIGPDALGLYSIAHQLAFAPVEKMSSIIPQVAFPAFSKMQFDIKTYTANFLKGLKLLNLIFIPSYIAIFVLAEDIVALLLGPKWMEIILPMRILCIIMPFRAFEMLFIPAMNGLGKSNITMLTSGFALVIMVCAFLVGLNWGYVGLCWAWVTGFPIIYFFMISMCIRNLEVNAAAIAQTYKTPVISSIGILMIGILLMNNYQHVMNPLLKITAFLTSSILLYCASVFFLDRQMITNMITMLGRRKTA